MIPSEDMWYAYIHATGRGTYFCRMAGCSMRALPKTCRWLHHLRHSSTTDLDWRMTAQAIMKRSWLKFDTTEPVSLNHCQQPAKYLLITMKPWCSWPSKPSTGTLVLLNSTKAVPAVVE
jgi:hypothetical protein